MATSTVELPKPGVPGKPVKVFSSKSARKAYRKAASARVVSANYRADRAIYKETKQQFYRRLRMVKQNRHRVAREMHELAGLIGDLRRELVRTEHRCPAVDPTLVAAAVRLVGRAERTADVLAGQYREFAHKRILFQKR